MKKVIISIILCMTLILPTMALASSDVTINLNGAVLETPVAPKIVNGRTMLPMRAIFEALGAKVTWIPEDRIIFATKGEYLIVMQVDNNFCSVRKNGAEENESITLDVAPFIENDHTLVPVRAVAEALDATVHWVEETRTVVIKSAN